MPPACLLVITGLSIPVCASVAFKPQLVLINIFTINILIINLPYLYKH
jgi:hypothetical protein